MLQFIHIQNTVHSVSRRVVEYVSGLSSIFKDLTNSLRSHNSPVCALNPAGLQALPAGRQVPIFDTTTSWEGCVRPGSAGQWVFSRN